MTIERIKELLEIAAGVSYFDTYYDISTYDKSKSEVRMHAAGEDYIVSVDELAEDTDIAFYRWEKIE
jgi:hypothetical protein